MRRLKTTLGAAHARLRAAAAAVLQRRNGRAPLSARTVLSALGLFAATAAGVSLAAIFLGLPRLPAPEALWAYNRAPGVTFLDSQGEIIGVRGPFYGRRVALEDLPDFVPQAFLAIEDRRFYEHAGIDALAILRAALANLTAGRTVQGGSTLSQQIAKNLFLTPDQTVLRKIQEMALAARLEALLTKDQLLELYLNRVYLGDQAFGVDAAARRYFARPATQLTLAQAALLAGLPKAPSRTAPTAHFERARARQRVVLQAMTDAGFITPDQRDAAIAEPIEAPARPPGEGALGYAFDLAVEEADRLLGERAPDLVIRLTLDPRAQRIAHETVRRRLGRFAHADTPLQAAMVLADREGGVQALVGGVDYGLSQFNRAVHARRQPGSAFKAFVYAAALEQGLEPEDVRYDEPTVIEGWRPTNYDEAYQGAVTVRRAFAQSLNTIAAQVGHEAGLPRIVDLARRAGVTLGPDPSDPVARPIPPSITLGTLETSVWDMTQGFSTFMLEGQRRDLHLVQSIHDSGGVALYQRPSGQPTLALSPEVARQMTSLMGAAVLHGTGTRAQIRGWDVAGKTGTSQNWRDAWFVGYTATHTAGVWVGLDNAASMTSVRGLGRVTGGSLPAEIWADVMQAVLRDVEPARLAGIEQPGRTPRQVELAAFYEALREALGRAEPPKPTPAAPPPLNFLRRPR